MKCQVLFASSYLCFLASSCNFEIQKPSIQGTHLGACPSEGTSVGELRRISLEMVKASHERVHLHNEEDVYYWKKSGNKTSWISSCWNKTDENLDFGCHVIGYNLAFERVFNGNPSHYANATLHISRMSIVVFFKKRDTRALQLEIANFFFPGESTLRIGLSRANPDVLTNALSKVWKKELQQNYCSFSTQQ